MFDIAVPAMIGVALIVVLGIVFTILYKRATRDEAFVRTGLGGKPGAAELEETVGKLVSRAQRAGASGSRHAHGLARR